jgi:membrane fusion protein (multidrug efflux system)
VGFQNAKVTFDFAQKEFDRVKKLRAQFLATNAELQTAKQNLANAELNFNNQKNQKNRTGKLIRSSCKCSIISINVQPGQVVPNSGTLLTYANIHKIQIRLGIESEDLPKIHLNQKVHIKPIYDVDTPYVGYVNHITDQINPKTGLVDIVAQLENGEKLIPGSMVRGEIFLDPQKMALSVPRSAILYENKKAFIFIDSNGKALKRWVTVGNDDGKFVVILSGVKENDLVVTIGNYELENGMAIRKESEK